MGFKIVTHVLIKFHKTNIRFDLKQKIPKSSD